MFSHVSISQRENLNVIFKSEKLKKLDGIVNEINKLKINNAGYELNTPTTSNAQGNLTSNPDTVTHTSGGILDQKLLNCQTIGEVSVLPPLTNPRIDEIRLVPQTLLMPAVKEIFSDAKLGKAWTNRTPRRISRTGIDRSTPIFTLIHSGMRKSSTPSSSDSSKTIIPIGTSETTTSSPCGVDVIPKIDDIQ